MCNASVTNLVSGGAVFSAILVVQRLRRAGRTSVNHITRFYLREISFLTNFLFFTYCIRRIILVVLSCFFARTNIVGVVFYLQAYEIIFSHNMQICKVGGSKGLVWAAIQTLSHFYLRDKYVLINFDVLSYLLRYLS